MRELVLERWPERYQSMPWGRALLALHRTARVYENETTLIDPRTGRTWPTLLPRDGSQTAQAIAAHRVATPMVSPRSSISGPILGAPSGESTAPASPGAR